MRWKNKPNNGFTIVELLIVIVVIGILGTIIVVSYVGISSNARTASARATAEAVKDKAEAYNSLNSSYPSISELTAATGLVQIPDTVTLVTFAEALVDGDISASNGEKTVAYAVCSDGSSNTGAQVIWWDYTIAALSYTNVEVSPNSFSLGVTSGSGITCS